MYISLFPLLLRQPVFLALLSIPVVLPPDGWAKSRDYSITTTTKTGASSKIRAIVPVGWYHIFSILNSCCALCSRYPISNSKTHEIDIRSFTKEFALLGFIRPLSLTSNLNLLHNEKFD